MPFRGSNFNNTSNGGVGALNLNNERSNSNNNIGFRSASPQLCQIDNGTSAAAPCVLGLRGLFPFQ